MSTLPPSSKFVTALRSLYLSKRISDVQWSWLRAHYLAPDHTLSTMDLARVTKYEKHGGVNLHYGRFGAELAGRLSYQVPEGEAAASTFATFSSPDADAPETRWRMRPEMVDAIRELKWFGK